MFGLFSSVVTAETAEPSKFELDYDKLLYLDAESLAEQGILSAYNELKSKLSEYVGEPANIEEVLDNDLPSYKVKFLGQEYEVYGPNIEDSEGQSWGRATYAFFQLINAQLKGSSSKFYALYGGNELGGMFLTKEQYCYAIKSLPRKADWPYIPKHEHPWYGQPN
ncbi:MAG: hypothetical protein COB04_13150 [Gammaproteobacteria bacterium]|nr:MAG: hypothetical protein COB04_13150 [Gammaproteobacteria bacterium]